MNVILITEKLVKIYLKEKETKIFNIYGTFIPLFKNDNFYAPDSLIKKIIKYSPDYICIGYDVDENGEFMAYSLKNSLKKTFNIEKIFRTPLTEKGYIMFNDFPDISDLIEIKKKERIFMKKQKALKISPLGFRKTIALNELEKNIKKRFTPKNGTSTFTYIYKKENECKK